MTGNRGNARNPQRRRRRPSGVPVMLVIVLLIIALLMGALAGFIVARKTDTHIHELQAANDRVTELENTLTLIGYPLGDDVDPQQWAYDSTARDSALEDLNGGNPEDDDEVDLWDDDTLLDATLPEDTDPVVVAEFEGGQLMSNEVIPEYNDRLTLLIFSGHSAEEVAEETLDSVLKEKAGDKLVALRATELGMTELSEEDLAEIRRQASENYETMISDYLAFSDEEGMTRESAVQSLEEENGITLESIVESLKQNYWTQKYFDSIVKDITVTDEDVQAYYDRLVASQRQAYTEYPEEFEYDHLTGALIVYNPEGYRAVRDILIPFDVDTLDEVATLSELIELGTADEDTQSKLDALYAPLEETAKEIQQKLADGQAFTDLMDEYGCDPDLKDEPLRSEGYYINSNSFVNSIEYIKRSMMLEQPGQVSEPLRSSMGVHLVEYIRDITPGEVPLESVKDAVSAAALKQKQTEYYEQQRNALLEAAQVKYYPERLR